MTTFTLLHKYAFWRKAALFLGALIAMLFFEHPLVVGIGLLVFLMAGTMEVLWRMGLQRKEVFILLFFALFLHLLPILFLSGSGFDAFISGGADYEEYHTQARHVAERISQGNFSLRGLGLDHLFPVLVGYVYWFTIPHVLMGQLLGVWLSVLATLFLFLLVREIGGSFHRALLVGFLASLYPSFLLFSGALLEDSLLIVSLLAGLLFLMKSLKLFSWKVFFSFYGALLLAAHVRSSVGIVLGIASLFSFILWSTLSPRKNISSLGLVVLLILFVPFISEFLTQSAWGGSFGQALALPLVGTEVEMSSGILSGLGKIAQSFLGALLGPFPWEIQSSRNIFFLAETIPWYFLLFLVGRGIFRSFQERRTVAFPLILFGAGVFLLLSLYEMDSGMTMRLRIPAFLALLSLVSFSFPVRTKAIFSKIGSWWHWIKFHEKIVQRSTVLLLSLIFGSIALANQELLFAFLLLGFLSMGTLFLIRKIGIYTSSLGILFLLVVLVHLGATLFIHYGEFYPFGGKEGSDQRIYHRVGTAISQDIRQGNFSLASIKTYELEHYYPLLLGGLYAATTPAKIIGKMVSVWFVGISVIVLYLIALELGLGRKAAVLSGYLGGVLPSYLYFGSLLLKEGLVVFLVLFALLSVIKLIKHFSWRTFSLFALAVFWLIHFREYLGFILLGIFVVSWLFLPRLEWRTRLAYAVVLFPLLGFLPQFWGHGYFAKDQIAYYLKPEVIASYRAYSDVAQQRDKEINRALQNQVKPSSQGTLQVVSPSVGSPPQIAKPTPPQIPLPAPSPPSQNPSPVSISPKNPEPGSTIAAKADFENPLIFGKSYLASLASVALGPFPWHIRYSRQLFVLIETIPWIVLLIFVFKGIFAARSQWRVMIPVLMVALGIIALLALFLNNYGTYMRIRIPAFLVLLPFAVKGIQTAGIWRFSWGEWKEKIRSFFHRTQDDRFLKMRRLFLGGIVMLLGIALFDRALGFSLLFLFSFILGTFLMGRRFGLGKPSLIFLFSVVLSFHLIGTLFVHYAEFYPFGRGEGDQKYYHRAAVSIAQDFRQGDFSWKSIEQHLRENDTFDHYYPLLIGAIYVVGVPDQLFGKMLNVWLAGLSAVLVFLIARQLGAQARWALVPGYLVGFYPSYLYFGSLLLRESIVAVLVLSFVLWMLKTLGTFSARNVFGVLLLLFLLVHFRFYVGLIGGIAFVASFFMCSSIAWRSRLRYGLFLMLLVGCIPVLWGYGYYGISKVTQVLMAPRVEVMGNGIRGERVITPFPFFLFEKSQEETVLFLKPWNPNDKQVLFSRESLERGRLPWISEERTSDSLHSRERMFENPFSFFKYSFLSFASVALGPFPWELHYARQLFVLGETIPWALFIFFTTKGILRSLPQWRRWFPIILVSFGIFAGITLTIEDLGTLMRIRIPAFLVLFTLFPFYFQTHEFGGMFSKVFSFFRERNKINSSI